MIRIIYLDNGATTKVYPEVLQAFVEVNESYWANSSSSHCFGFKTGQLLDSARKQVAVLLNVEENEIVFTSGGTESNNIAIKGIADRYQKNSSHIITSAVEHPSVLKPIEQLQERGYRVTVLPVNEHGMVSAEDVKKSICSDTILVSVMHVNNELGSIQPIYEIGNVLRNYENIFFHVDGVQGYGKVPLDLKKAEIDLFSLSAHKFHGLKGSGILYVRQGTFLHSLIAGGSHEMSFRSGTVNVAGAVTLAKAMHMSQVNYEKKINHLFKIKEIMCEQIGSIAGVEINSPPINCAPHIFNFSIPDVNVEVLMRMLNEKDICISASRSCSSSHHLPSAVLKYIGKSDKAAYNSVRLSTCYETTEEEIIYVVNEIRNCITELLEVTK